ncbi:MAG: GspE/PulE/PilB domain-containing protein [Ktedonobacterales bacterium]
MSSGEPQRLMDRLRWHIQQALHHEGVCALLVLHPLAQSATEGPHAACFDPVVERIRELIRKRDVVEVDAADGIGIVLRDADSEGARAVFMRLRDALCSPIPPRAPDEVAVTVAFGYVASSSCLGGNTTVEGVGMAAQARVDAGTTISSPEMVSTAMLDAARQPQTILTLTLPVVARSSRHARYAHRGRSVERETALARRGLHPSLPEQVAVPAGTVSGADEVGAQQRPPQRGHLRLIASQHVTSPEIEAMRSLARAMKVPFVRMPASLPHSCRSVVHPTIACELRAVPIGRTRSTLTMAMHHPTDTDALQRLRASTGLSIFPVLAAPDEIDRALRQIMER